MEQIFNLLHFLPKYEEIKDILQNEPEADYILQLAVKNMDNIQIQNASETEEASFLIHSLADRTWERIHTGHFSEVPLSTRKINALAQLYKIFYLLFESTDQRQLEKCSALLDEAVLVGCTDDLYKGSDKLKDRLMQYFNEALVDANPIELPILPALQRQSCICDIPILDCPTVEEFRAKYYEPQRPVLLLNTIAHWPALEKWRDLNYLLEVAGNRTVPIEIGNNYANDDWSQQLVKIRDFLQRQFAAKATGAAGEIEYLAQHELFEQIPALKADICVPDFCSVSDKSDRVDVKAWLGPKGTVSPMHYDAKQNLLCQVFGVKTVILAAADETPNLYAVDSAYLNNTSQIDAAHVDYERFPLAANVRFYRLTLQAGDCLFIPFRWWHYVRADSESFSVSFWWE